MSSRTNQGLEVIGSISGEIGSEASPIVQKKKSQTQVFIPALGHLTRQYYGHLWRLRAALAEQAWAG